MNRIWVSSAIFVCFMMFVTSVVLGAESKCKDYESVPFKKISTPAFIDEYDGKCVSVKGMFIGQNSMTQLLQMMKVDTKDRVFITAFAPDTNPGEISPSTGNATMIISVDKDKSDFVFEWSKGTLFEMKGKAKKSAGMGSVGIHIHVDEIQKVEN